MVLHIHDIFQQAPSLSRWSYYCYYCLQATLVLLMRVLEEPTLDETAIIARICETSVHIFEQIELKASKRCAEVVRHVLDQWNGRRRLHHSSTSITNDARGTGSQLQVLATNVVEFKSQIEQGATTAQQMDTCLPTDLTDSFSFKATSRSQSRAKSVRHKKNDAENHDDFYDGTFDFVANTDWPAQTLEEFFNFPLFPTTDPT